MATQSNIIGKFISVLPKDHMQPNAAEAETEGPDVLYFCKQEPIDVSKDSFVKNDSNKFQSLIQGHTLV